MSQTSWRHHYIPKFYLKNFTNHENKFHIYSIEKNDYKSTGKLFSPESHFFEIDGNTLKMNESVTDFIEADGYKSIDNDVAALFNKINTSNEPRYGLTEEDMPMIQFFVAHLFWRNPANNEYVKKYLREKGLNGVGLKLRDTDTNEVIHGSQIEQDIIDNPTTYRVIKFFLPIHLYPSLFQNRSPLTIMTFNPGEAPSLICDNPLILRNPEKFNIYEDDFILPLSRDKILIRTPKVKSYYQNTDKIFIDYLLLKQATKYVATTSMAYIPMLNTIRQRLPINIFRQWVFSRFVDD